MKTLGIFKSSPWNKKAKGFDSHVLREIQNNRHVVYKLRDIKSLKSNFFLILIFFHSSVSALVQDNIISSLEDCGNLLLTG